MTAFLRLVSGFALTTLIALSSCSRNELNINQIKHLKQQINRKIDSGDYPGAAADLDRLILLRPKDGLTYYNRGVVRLRLGRAAEAIADYNEAIKYNPKHSSSYINRARLKYIMNDFKGALRDYESAIKVDPLKASGTGYDGIASIYYAQGNLDIARQFADLAIKANPVEAGFYAQRGVIMYSLRDFTSAIKDYSRAIKLQPLFASHYSNRANAQAGLAKYGPAIEDMSMYIRLLPNDHRGFISRAIFRSKIGQDTASKLDLEKAAEMLALKGSKEEAIRLMAIKDGGHIGRLELNPETVTLIAP